VLEDAAITPLPSEQPKGGSQKKRGGAPKGNTNGATHGLQLLKRSVRKLGTRATDGRTRLARTLLDLRAGIVADLGGQEQLSRAQQILIDDVARLTLWIDSIDGWLLTLPSIVNKKKRTLVPVVAQRTALVETRARLLQALGLERRAKRVPSLAEQLRALESPGEPPDLGNEPAKVARVAKVGEPSAEVEP
jgi:hypothetical protein